MTQLQEIHPDRSRKGGLLSVRVLDLSRLVAGNMATHILADHGAEVIKIEPPKRGDDLRNWRVEGVEVFWEVYARGKLSVELDFRSGEGRNLLLSMVADADVLVENFIPGKMESWNLGTEALLAINPNLVILRVSGWGQTGPMAQSPGFGTLIEARSGWAHLNGPAECPPSLPPLALADMIAGLYGANAVLTALRAIEVLGGKGQVIDLSLLEPLLSIIGAEAAQMSVTGQPTMRSGNQSAHAAPRNIYGTKDGGWIALSGSMQSMAERVFKVIGCADLIDDVKFRTNDQRVANRKELDRIISDWIGARTQQQVLSEFKEAGVTAGPVHSMEDVITDPHVTERGSLVKLQTSSGILAMHNVVARLSATPGAISGPAPTLGQHTQQVLGPYLQKRKAKT